jgi:hypothetical protein
LDILNTLSSHPFYNKFVHLPSENEPVPEEIQNNTKFWPFFRNVLGAMDGTHINCNPSASERQSAQNRKGRVTQNCLACCSFDLQFQYMLSGWDGCSSDAAIFNDAHQFDLLIPPGKFYLADAGFGMCDALLIPYRKVKYHLAEWGCAALRYVLVIDNEKKPC